MRTLKLAAVSAVALAAAFTATAANANFINFESLPGGGTIADPTPLSVQYASLGVTFTASLNGTPVSPIITNYAGGPSGTYYENNFVGNSSNGAPGNARYNSVSMLFSTPTDDISLSFNNFIYAAAYTTTFNAYDAAGNLLQTFVAHEGNGWAPIALTADGVSRLDLISNPVNGSTSFFGFDHLSFSPTAAVPEPASWGTMLIGLGMVGGVLRRRARVSRVVFA